MIAFENFNQAQKILESDDYKSQIFNIIIDKLNVAINDDLDEVILFYYQEENVYHYITYKEYKKSLEKAINYFVSIEEYETCTKIKNIINILK